MASKAQRAAVRSRADKVNAAIGTFIPRHAVNIENAHRQLPAALVAALGVNALMQQTATAVAKPLSADPDLYMATMATETPIQRDMVLDMLHAPMMEMSQAEIDRMKSYDRMWANLESGHTADGLNEYDLRETTQDVVDSLPENDECGDPDDFCRKCGQFWGWQELNDNGHCLHCANKLRADPADEPDDEPDDDYEIDDAEAKDQVKFYREMGWAEPAEDTHWALKEAVQRIADNFNDEQAALIDAVSDERMDEIENGTNTTPFKAYEYAALIRRQARQKDYDENSLNLGNAFAGE
jgi:hypothetical protein